MEQQDIEDQTPYHLCPYAGIYGIGSLCNLYACSRYRYEEYVRSEPPATNLILEEEAAPADSLSDEKIREMEEFFNQFNSESYE